MFILWLIWTLRFVFLRATVWFRYCFFCYFFFTSTIIFTSKILFFWKECGFLYFKWHSPDMLGALESVCRDDEKRVQRWRGGCGGEWVSRCGYLLRLNVGGQGVLTVKTNFHYSLTLVEQSSFPIVSPRMWIWVWFWITGLWCWLPAWLSWLLSDTGMCVCVRTIEHTLLCAHHRA